MIVVNKERIYSIDVYSFKSSQNIPYQLTFELNDCGEYHDVSLVNLTGQNDSPYCPELRSTISEIVYGYLVEKKCTLYFNIEYSGNNKLLLLIKFLRWIKLDRRVIPVIEITTHNEVEFIEVKISLIKRMN